MEMLCVIAKVLNAVFVSIHSPLERGGVVVTTSASDAGGTGSIPGTGSFDRQIWLSTLGTVYPS